MLIFCFTAGCSIVTLEDALKFATGVTELPPQGFHPQTSAYVLTPSEQITHPIASTCNNEIGLSPIVPYELFKQIMEEGIKGAMGLITY